MVGQGMFAGQRPVFYQLSCHGHGVVRSFDPLKFWGSNYITGTAEPKVVKFCTQVGYINSSNRMTYQQRKGVFMVT